MTVNNEEEKLKQGWVAIWRCSFKSEIWEQEPWRFKAWIYMIGQANHSDKKEFGQRLERGQLLINRIEDFRKEIRWKKGFVYKTPSVNAVKHFWKWLRDKKMVDTKRTTRGTIMTILNYGKFQDIKPIIDTNVSTEGETEESTNEELTTPHDRQQLKQLKPLNNIVCELLKELELDEKDLQPIYKQYDEEQIVSALKIYQDEIDGGRLKDNPIGYLTYLCQVKAEWKENENEW